MDGTLRVQVTQADIDRGLADCPYRCAVAYAVSRATGRRDCWVGGHIAGFDGILARYVLSRCATAFVGDLDGGRPVSPTTFVLTRIEEGH